MNFHLSGLFQNQNTAGQIFNASDAKEALDIPVSRQTALFSLQPGSSITGTVVSMQDGVITVRLLDDSMLTASLQQEINFNPGSVVSFLVQSNNNHQVTLNPLFTNVMSSGTNIENALQAAGLPLNQKSADMVGQMMQQGMSIDKNSLLNMYREIMTHQTVDVGDVVRLSKMNLEISELNAENLRMYDAMNHQLSEGIGDLIHELQTAMTEMSARSLDQAAVLFRQIVDSFLPDTAESGMFDVKPAEEDMVNNSGGQTMSDPDVINSRADTQLSNVSKLILDYMLPDETADIAPQTTVDALKLIARLFDEHKIDPKILSQPSVGQLLKQNMEDSWLLKPENVADKERVEAYYSRLRAQTAQLSRIVETATGKESLLSQRAGQLSHNIDFINQLNQTFAYIQIPLKMSGQNANGDLYVYSNKKSLSTEDGTVSAYLHLSMDHLGSVDCYVTMRDDKVTTNFKVQDDSILELMEQNISWLYERLQKRGYHLRSTVSIADEQTTVIGEMEKQLGPAGVPISRVSFDARA